MEAFYEESAVNRNAEKGERNYKVMHYLSWVFLFVGIVFAVLAVMTIPVKSSGEGMSAEDYQAKLEAYPTADFICLFFTVVAVTLLLVWFLLFRMKQKVNVSYDYVFVSGELRIAKVFNINRRKLMENIDCEDIMQIGDVDNTSYSRLRSDPNTKEIVYTPNSEPADDKFFMYILVNNGGKRLLILECRELMLMNILKFAKHSTLESDYVMQEKKKTV